MLNFSVLRFKRLKQFLLFLCEFGFMVWSRIFLLFFVFGINFMALFGVCFFAIYFRLETTFFKVLFAAINKFYHFKTPSEKTVYRGWFLSSFTLDVTRLTGKAWMNLFCFIKACHFLYNKTRKLKMKKTCIWVVAHVFTQSWRKETKHKKWLTFLLIILNFFRISGKLLN